MAAPSEPDAMLSVKVARQLSDSFTLHAEFDAPPGFTMILGPSGSGKTSLLDCIAGLIRPDSGRVALGARVLFDAHEKIDVAVASRRLGYLFQNLALFPHLSVAENVRYGIAKLPARERERRTASMLEAFRIEHLRDRKPSETSGGERQRTALARALVTDPELLMLDEPMTALDAATKSNILDDLRQWNSTHHIPVLYVTHATEEAFALGERVVVLEGGRVIAQGMPQQVLRFPRRETIAQIVGFENVFDATVTTVNEAQGTMACRLARDGVELEVPLTDAVVGTSVRIAVRAGDIIIAGEKPRGLSARNTIAGRVTDLKRAGATVIIAVDCGVPMEVHVTPRAVEELQLAAGREVWLVVKTYSCSVVEPA